MSKIIPKLNLNKTPQLVENNSLIMAKNIRLLEDGTIGPDTSMYEIETSIGDPIEHSEYHPQTTNTITKYYYSILNPSTTIDVIKNGTILPIQTISDYVFDFNTYKPNDGQEIINGIFSNIESDIVCNIYSYKFVDDSLQWIRSNFNYDINNNLLCDRLGYCLTLAVKLNVYNNPTIITSDDYYYIIMRKSLLNKNVIINGVSYKILNPVYKYTDTITGTIPAYTNTWITYNNLKYIGQIVGLNNKIYFFKESNYIKDSSAARTLILTEYPNEVFVGTTPLPGQRATFDINSEGYITRNNLLFQDSTIAATLIPNINDRIKIFEYDEIYNIFKIIECGWRYSGGKIDGCETINIVGNHILTINEYDLPTGVNVQIKHINLEDCKPTDDESIYTQNPNIPLTNLILEDTYNATIPSGVYQFYIRYKIKDNIYTNWFPCSKELFAGCKTKIATVQGELKYIDKHRNSDTSFIFRVEHLYPNYNSLYQKFQLGFIASSDDGGIYAREWKEFDLNTTSIWFSFSNEDIKETNIDELLEYNFEIFNAKNCINYKNRLYISNYKETDFNPLFQSYASLINVKIKTKTIGTSQQGLFFDNQRMLSSHNNNNYDYLNVVDSSNKIANKWGLSKYFTLTYTEEDTDARGYFNNIPYETQEYIHIENSNVKSTDSIACNPYSEDNSQLNSLGTPTGGWMNSIHNFPTNSIDVLAIYIKVGNNWIDISSDYRNTDQYNSNNVFGDLNKTFDSVINNTDNFIRQRIAHFSVTDNRWYLKALDNNYYPITDYYIVCSEINELSRIHKKIGRDVSEIDLSDPDFSWNDFPYYHVSPNGNIHYNPEFDVVKTKKKVSILHRNIIFNSNIITSYTRDETLYPTLLPFTSYNFYVHYVKRNGVITNGYLINKTPIYITEYKDENGDLITKYDNDNIILYPSFDTIVVPSHYVGCFITVSRCKNRVAQLFNVSSKLLDNGDYLYEADCMELDTMLYSNYNNIKIYSSDGTLVSDNGKYYSSGNTENVSYFANSGTVVWTTQSEIITDEENSDDLFWIVDDTTEHETLIKLTPFIDLSNGPQSYDNFTDINGIGYSCYVKKLLKNDLYVSGDKIYQITKTENSGNNASLQLEDANDNDYVLIRYNDDFRIKSNFNLEYLTTTEDIQSITKSITSNGNISTYLVFGVNSLISSFIYTLDNCYYNYTRKYYDKYQNNKKIEFDNTIRRSIQLSDEANETFKFIATDYYNIPTNRGAITSLISIINFIYVHCEHSLFRFDDNKTLNSKEEEVILQENDIFNSGISEIFDSQHGYGGLSKKNHNLITYNAYVFYDNFANVIYLFDGRELKSISKEIQKLLNDINPTDVIFLNDENHDRFFINLLNNNGNVCLSYNYNIKSFISIHDFTFKFGFNTRSNSYLIHYNTFQNNVIGWSIYKLVNYLKLQSNIVPTNNVIVRDNVIPYSYFYSSYQNCYKKSIIKINDCDDINLNEVNSVNSCIDIVVNTQYEAIKVLNYISWICSEIKEYGTSENTVSEEIINRYYPANKLRIYSDSSMSELFELLYSNGVAKISNQKRNIDSNGNIIPNPESWQYPQFNCGVWSMNYFRNIINTTDIFAYKNPSNKIIGQYGHSETTDLTPYTNRENLTQENSLLYGKYFVIRFIFNNRNFKFENVILRMNDYEKTK